MKSGLIKVENIDREKDTYANTKYAKIKFNSFCKK